MRPIPRRRQPTTPGEILREEFLIPLGMTQRQLADHLACDVKVVNRMVNGRTSVTGEMALRLGATFRTTHEFWLNAPKAADLHHVARHLPSLPSRRFRRGSPGHPVAAGPVARALRPAVSRRARAFGGLARGGARGAARAGTAPGRVSRRRSGTRTAIDDRSSGSTLRPPAGAWRGARCPGRGPG